MKTVLITGANKGIGFATAKKFLEAGFAVILAGRSSEKLNSAIQKLDYKNAYPFVWDISNTDIAEQKIKEAAENFGQIDIFIDNAGIVTYHDLDGCKMLGETEESWDTTMQTNLKGTYFAV